MKPDSRIFINRGDMTLIDKNRLHESLYFAFSLGMMLGGDNLSMQGSEHYQKDFTLPKSVKIYFAVLTDEDYNTITPEFINQTLETLCKKNNNAEVLYERMENFDFETYWEIREELDRQRQEEQKPKEYENI